VADQAAQGIHARRALTVTLIDVNTGQGDVPWTVLTDPEGNEFCVLSPR